MIKHKIEKNVVKKLNVLVLAPRFPAINQPWIDTYLEQLQNNNFNFNIVSCTEKVKIYHKKVDILGFLDKTVPVILEKKKKLIQGSVRFLFKYPFGFLRITKHAWIKFFKSDGFIKSLKSTIRSLFCAYSVYNLKNINVIHSHSEFMAYYFFPWASFTKTPIILTFHGLEPYGLPQFETSRRRVLAEYITFLIVNTNAAKQQAIQIGYAEKKIKILPQGLPIDDFPFFPRPSPAANKEDPLLLLTIGRLHRDKGQKYIIKAMRNLLDNNIDTYWYCVGAGPEKENLQSLAERLKVIYKIKFYNSLKLETIQKLYQKCHLLVLPSLSSTNADEHVETQGVVLQEAQASGCIPIATRVGGIPECVRDNVDAILIQDRSHEEIVNAVSFLLENPKIWQNFQTEGRRNVEKNFSADKIGLLVAETLRRAVKQS